VREGQADRTCRVSADIGGTCTDLVFQFADNGETVARKVLSSPANPALAVIEGLKALPEGGAVDFLIHGTTVGINSVLQRRGAKVALLTTENFRDVYTIAGNDRRDIFAIHYRKPAPLIGREHIFTVHERLRADGSVEHAPRLVDLDRLVAAVASEGYEAIAVCLLFSYVNPAHELAVEAYLRVRFRSPFRTASRRSGASTRGPRPRSWTPMWRRWCGAICRR
jgi:N-methylhydantoinase A